MNRKLLVPLILILGMSWSIKATAHGAKINYETTQAIKIDATFDNGKPMSNAPVTVYSPQDPATPWQQGTTDEDGSFVFIPDRSQPGDWAIQVRQAGHGDLITLSLGDERSVTENTADTQVMSIQSKNASFTPAQIVIMIVAVTWGFVGTALYFAQK